MNEDTRGQCKGNVRLSFNVKALSIAMPYRGHTYAAALDPTITSASFPKFPKTPPIRLWLRFAVRKELVGKKKKKT